MAASKTYFARANYRFLPTDQTLTKGSTMFELDESEVWNLESRSASPEFQKASSRISRKTPSAIASRVGDGPSSLPVNVPDWSKILKEEYRENRRRDSDGDDYEEEYGENGNRIPPHEFLARQMARTKIASFSVHEGIGRTLKGRDLSTVRNAIWEKTGFQD
ncbi:uncharacterized protein LOC111372817 [Olea europaea var. sylvestris]|uniref:Senescence regulator n=1 Tax=Olea europaea subsp. europaea TaxID=158383 RepID=A0A8S0V7C7_OLEEU|nr:uncharacterized protein LOC111372817 [Olea europaea var. sylvestris]CAA3029344.1 Hypothetical predicted protein [Olea europaea subsp. europaea]